MAMPHAAPGDIIEVLDSGAAAGEFAAIALAKTDELELVRLVLPKGKVMPEHHVPGEVTLLCLQGEVSVVLHGGEQRLGPGQMLYLLGGQAHGVRAEQDAVLLLTMLLVPTRQG
jgi:quercetin dioxygenase-like cupin family protein